MPDAIAHYKLLDRIGTGGLGELYRARDSKFGRTAAVRLLPAGVVADSERLNRLLTAARRAAELSHPNIAALFDVGDASNPYLASEFVPGELLRTKLAGRPLDVRRAVDFVIQLADALAEAEGQGLIHGDIRAATIIITPKDRPKLLHFGLSAFTTSGSARPEAAAAARSKDDASSADQDARIDIRALGWVMYEMLTGRAAERGEGTEPSLPAVISRTLPPEIDAVIRKMVSKDPDKGYQTAATVAADLRAVAAILDARSAAVEAAPDSRRDSLRSLQPMAIAVLLAVLAFLAVWIWRSGGWHLSG